MMGGLNDAHLLRSTMTAWKLNTLTTRILNEEKQEMNTIHDQIITSNGDDLKIYGLIQSHDGANRERLKTVIDARFSHKIRQLVFTVWYVHMTEQKNNSRVQHSLEAGRNVCMRMSSWFEPDHLIPFIFNYWKEIIKTQRQFKSLVTGNFHERATPKKNHYILDQYSKFASEVKQRHEDKLTLNATFLQWKFNVRMATDIRIGKDNSRQRDITIHVVLKTQQNEYTRRLLLFIMTHWHVIVIEGAHQRSVVQIDRLIGLVKENRPESEGLLAITWAAWRAEIYNNKIIKEIILSGCLGEEPPKMMIPVVVPITPIVEANTPSGSSERLSKALEDVAHAAANEALRMVRDVSLKELEESQLSIEASRSPLGSSAWSPLCNDSYQSPCSARLRNPKPSYTSGTVILTKAHNPVSTVKPQSAGNMGQQIISSVFRGLSSNPSKGTSSHTSLHEIEESRTIGTIGSRSSPENSNVTDSYSYQPSGRIQRPIRGGERPKSARTHGSEATPRSTPQTKASRPNVKAAVAKVCTGLNRPRPVSTAVGAVGAKRAAVPKQRQRDPLTGLPVDTVPRRLR